MHPFSLTEEQIEEVSGATDPLGGTWRPRYPGEITFGIGETGHDYPRYEQMQ